MNSNVPQNRCIFYFYILCVLTLLGVCIFLVANSKNLHTRQKCTTEQKNACGVAPPCMVYKCHIIYSGHPICALQILNHNTTCDDGYDETINDICFNGVCHGEITQTPTALPTVSPTTSPTKLPTVSPTTYPTKLPTVAPTTSPTKLPTVSPTTYPSQFPSLSPSKSPTESPTGSPSKSPTESPSKSPTESPTSSPSYSPTQSPTKSPTSSPTNQPVPNYIECNPVEEFVYCPSDAVPTCQEYNHCEVQTVANPSMNLNLYLTNYLKANNSETLDQFGTCASIDGNTIVIGSFFEDLVPADNSGAAYVFYRDPITKTWSQQGYLKGSVITTSDQFGFSCAISGDTIVVGANTQDSGVSGINNYTSASLKTNSGAAYVFRFNGSSWPLESYLKASFSTANAVFGYSVDIDGDTVVVGARGEQSPATGINGDEFLTGASNSGAVYVFVRNDTTWTQQAYIKASNTGSSDNFGTSVSISGDILVVGANQEDSNGSSQSDNSISNSGAVYVFRRSGTDWAQTDYLKAFNVGWAGSTNQFGVSVSVSGDILVVGASNEASDAVGINGNGFNSARFGSGAAYIFFRNNTDDTWYTHSYLKASNPGSSDNFGSAVRVKNNVVTVSAINEDSYATGINGFGSDISSSNNAGAVYLFYYNSTTNQWSQLFYLKPHNTGASDNFGKSIAVSDDFVVVTGNFEDSNATQINGDAFNNFASNAGAAYVYDVTQEDEIIFECVYDNLPDATVCTDENVQPSECAAGSCLLVPVMCTNVFDFTLSDYDFRSTSCAGSNASNQWSYINQSVLFPNQGVWYTPSSQVLYQNNLDVLLLSPILYIPENSFAVFNMFVRLEVGYDGVSAIIRRSPLLIPEILGVPLNNLSTPYNEDSLYAVECLNRQDYPTDLFAFSGKSNKIRAAFDLDQYGGQFAEIGLYMVSDTSVQDIGVSVQSVKVCSPAVPTPAPTPAQPSNDSCVIYDMEGVLGVDYETIPFEINANVVQDPTNSSNNVMSVLKTGQSWGGIVLKMQPSYTFVFFPGQTVVSIDVYSTKPAPVVVRLKLENALNGGIFVEVDVQTTVSDQWETLYFDMNDYVTNPFDYAYEYNNVIVFMDFLYTPNWNGLFYFDNIRHCDAIIPPTPAPTIPPNAANPCDNYNETIYECSGVDCPCLGSQSTCDISSPCNTNLCHVVDSDLTLGGTVQSFIYIQPGESCVWLKPGARITDIITPQYTYIEKVCIFADSAVIRDIKINGYGLAVFHIYNTTIRNIEKSNFDDTTTVKDSTVQFIYVPMRVNLCNSIVNLLRSEPLRENCISASNTSITTVNYMTHCKFGNDVVITNLNSNSCQLSYTCDADINGTITTVSGSPCTYLNSAVKSCSTDCPCNDVDFPCEPSNPCATVSSCEYIEGNHRDITIYEGVDCVHVAPTATVDRIFSTITNFTAPLCMIIEGTINHYVVTSVSLDYIFALNSTMLFINTNSLDDRISLVNSDVVLFIFSEGEIDSIDMCDSTIYYATAECISYSDSTLYSIEGVNCTATAPVVITENYCASNFNCIP